MKLELKNDVMQIPEEIEFDIYIELNLTEGWSLGEIDIGTYSRGELYDDEKDRKYILLAKEKIKVKLNAGEIDVRGEMISSLEAQKKEALAKHHMHMKNLNEKLSKLRALTYQPVENQNAN